MNRDTRVVYVGSNTPATVERALGTVGATVDVVETAADCLRRLSSADCIVTAGVLPDATCLELCVQIRHRRSDVPIVVFPATGSEALAGAVVAAGADGYVPRSQGVETLSSRVSRLLPADDTSFDTADSGPEDPSKRLELLVDQSPLAIVEWNLEFEAISWNPAATELFGYTPREALGRSALELIVADADREDVKSHWERLVDASAAEGSSRNVNRNVREDGSVITCEWFNTPLVDDSGEVVSVLSFGQDVTDELERANALEALQETTHELMRAASVDEIAEIAMNATETVIDRSLAGIRFYDDETERLEIAATTSRLERTTGTLPPVGPGDGVLWDAYERQEPIVVDDASTELVPYEIDHHVESAIFHPLGEHGLLSIGSTGQRELEATDVHLVHVLAATVEAALDRAARERELERAKTILETVGDGICVLDRDGCFATVNDTMAEMTGYDRDELVGKHASAVLTEESLERGRRRVRKLVSADERGVTTAEVTIVTRSGARIPSEVNATLLSADDELEGVVGIVRDISDRKRMERELVDRRAKIESLHEIASLLDDCDQPAEIYDLTVIAAEDVLNFDVCVVDRVVGDYLEKAALSSHIADADYVERFHVTEGIAGKTYRDQQTYRLDEAESSEEGVNETDTYESLLSVPIGEHGVFQAASTKRDAFDRDDVELTELLLSHVTDRLDQLASQAELKDERDRFVALFENVPDAVVSIRYRGDEPIVEAVNAAFERVFGYDESEITGEPLDDYLVPPDRAAEATAINRRVHEGDIIEAEAKRRTADGLRDFMIRVVPIEIGRSTSRAFGLYTDITEQKQRQKRVEILNRVLRHDLRNGMNIVDGCAEMLAETVDDEHAEYVATIQDRAADLTDLAEKTRAVEHTLERTSGGTGPIDVSAMVGRTLSQFEREYPCVELERSVPDEVFARADEYLEMALSQLLENAAEHHDRPTPTVEITLRDQVDDGVIVLSVADDGPGIPRAERELLEEEREITQLRHASGLGLWLVDWVVTQSGGQLSFADNEPRGTVITLEVPRADPETVASDGD
ncbi:histidine kinase [Natronococcus pandeyae]|uniref:histidine kinase n=1 Tax=Natronococcus pandeyae TaxID=2055836 RepID=A0A8J8Q6R7_9EURY|nr:PAS domain S-box protein [Natronococcus pandeyae]TYL40127.1 histidine kinase [Natronococcus pandeyae]